VPKPLTFFVYTKKNVWVHNTNTMVGKMDTTWKPDTKETTVSKTVAVKGLFYNVSSTVTE
jgi:hypothetical protein